jgi:hypothetical protein
VHRTFVGGSVESLEVVACRHGYLPAGASVQLRPGVVQKVVLMLKEGDTSAWWPH